MASKKSNASDRIYVNAMKGVPKQVDKFTATLNEMRKNKVNTDVIIESYGEEFHVHKFILTTGSVYFQTMFENNLRETISNRVKFPTISKEIMRLIIDFLYFNDSDLPGDCDTVIELFQAAHMLKIEALVEKCSVHLVINIDLSNWFKVWKLGDTYENHNIIGKVVEFTVQNLERIIETPKFLLLDFHNLLKVIQEINKRNKKGTNSILKSILNWAKLGKERENLLAELFNSFSGIDVSREFLISLLDNEPIIRNNAEVLLMFLRLQLKKCHTDSYPIGNRYRLIT